MPVDRACQRLLCLVLLGLGFSPGTVGTDLPGVRVLDTFDERLGQLCTASLPTSKEGSEFGGFSAQHLQLNHWLGNHAYTSPLTSIVPYMPILHDLHPGMSGGVFKSDAPTHTPAALQLLRTPANPVHPRSCSQQFAAVVDLWAVVSHHEMTTVIDVLDQSMLYGPLTSHVSEATAAQQSVVQASEVLGGVWLSGMCLLEGKPITNKSVGQNPVIIGACLTDDACHSQETDIQLSRKSSPPSLASVPLLHPMCLLEESIISNTTVHMALLSSDSHPTALDGARSLHSWSSPTEDMGKGIAGGQARKGPGKLSSLSADTYGRPTPPLPFSVLLRDVMFEVFSIWRDAICLEAAPALKALCAAATGGFSVLVMGAEIVMILLATAIAWLIRRQLDFEHQYYRQRGATRGRVKASFINHFRHIRDSNDLRADLESVVKRMRLAQHLTHGHHMRAGRRHKAVRATLRRLSRQQTQARRQGLALRKQQRRACAQQTALGQQMRHVQEVLETVLQVGRSMRDGNNGQAVDLMRLKDIVLEHKDLRVGDIQALRQEIDSLTAQLSTELRTQDLQQSHSALIAELRSQLSAGQETHEALDAKVSTLEQAQAAAAAASETQAAAITSLSAMDAALPTQVGRMSSGGGADADVHFGMADLDENGSLIIEPSADSHSCGAELDRLAALRSMSPVETHTIPANKIHHDNRGDFATYQVERSGPSYLSTVTSIPPSKPASFSVPVVKPSRFQQHNEVFDHVNSGMELGSPKGHRGHPSGNPFGDRLTPAHSQSLTAGVQLSADSAATGCSTTPLLQQGRAALPEIVQPPPVKRANSVVRLLRKLKPQLSRRR